MTSAATAAPLPNYISRTWLHALLVVALLSLLPLLGLVCSDWWFRSDWRFFPLLLWLPPLWLAWRGPRGQALKTDNERRAPGRSRTIAAISCWLGSGLLAVAAGVVLSPWLALLSWTTAWVAWQLQTAQTIPWPRLLKWTLPWIVLLLLPQSDATDVLPSFANWVTYGASSVLDLLEIAHLPIRQSLELSIGRYDVAAACRGLGSPYLLLSLAILLCMATRCSLVVGLLTLVSVPLWGWGGGVLLVVSSVWLAEQQQVILWPGSRLWIAQGIILVANLSAILLCKRGWLKLLAPFTAYSAGVGAIHRFFNRIALWPEPDPLRSRRGRSASKPAVQASDRGPWPGSRIAAVCMSTAGVLYLAAGSLSLWQLFGSAGQSPSFFTMLTHPRASSAAVEKLWSRESLPDELQEMQLVDFQISPMLGAAHGQLVSAVWTYQNAQQTIHLNALAPSRGPLPLAQSRRLDGAQLIDEPARLHVSAEADGLAAGWIEEMTLHDPLVGGSYVAGTWWSLDGLPRAADASTPTAFPASETHSGPASLGYRPTTANLVLQLDGDTADDPQQRQVLWQMLLQATRHLQGP